MEAIINSVFSEKKDFVKKLLFQHIKTVVNDIVDNAVDDLRTWVIEAMVADGEDGDELAEEPSMSMPPTPTNSTVKATPTVLTVKASKPASSKQLKNKGKSGPSSASQPFSGSYKRMAEEDGNSSSSSSSSNSNKRNKSGAEVETEDPIDGESAPGGDHSRIDISTSSTDKTNQQQQQLQQLSKQDNIEYCCNYTPDCTSSFTRRDNAIRHIKDHLIKSGGANKDKRTFNQEANKHLNVKKKLPQ